MWEWYGFSSVKGCQISDLVKLISQLSDGYLTHPLSSASVVMLSLPLQLYLSHFANFPNSFVTDCQFQQAFITQLLKQKEILMAFYAMKRTDMEQKQITITMKLPFFSRIHRLFLKYRVVYLEFISCLDRHMFSKARQITLL